MSISIRIVSTNRERHDFIRLPWRIYAGDPNWVPPLLSKMRNTIDAKTNGYLRKGPHRLFIAYKDGQPAGRIMAGVDERMHEAKHSKDGWFALFESLDDFEVARGLLEAAYAFLHEAGCDKMRGPLSPTGDDNYRGLLYEGFDSPPVLMDSYNPKYYDDLITRFGLAKNNDYFAYRVTYRMPKNPEAAAYAQKRYGFRLDKLDKKHLGREVKDIKTILDRAMPEWPDQMPPSEQDLAGVARDLKAYADPDLIYIARAGSEPIGFSLTMPDLNQALIHLNGRLIPLGWLKFLYWRRRIVALRFFVLFVVPQWRQKGVTAAIYVKTFEEAAKKGMQWGEGSSIREENAAMRRDAERAGGVHYKTYRIYSKII